MNLWLVSVCFKNMKAKKKNKVIVVMPAYNAAKTLEEAYREIPRKFVDEILLVDDCSEDNTAEISRRLGIKTIVHKKNKGYGGNQKTCYKNALKDGADIVVMLHPDRQYDPKKIPEIIKPLKEDNADVVYGSRMLVRGMAKKGGMPLWKRIGNFLLTVYMNMMIGSDLTDSATGYIAYSRKVLESIPFEHNDDGFCFDEEAIIQCASKKFRIAEVPIPTRYDIYSSSIGLKKAIKYGLTLFFKVMQYKIHQLRIIRFKQFE